MRANRIVFFQPGHRDLTGLSERCKQIGIQDLFPKSAIEAFDIGVLGRFAGLDEVKPNLVFTETTADAVVLTVDCNLNLLSKQ
jgi:hypothetical protein